MLNSPITQYHAYQKFCWKLLSLAIRDKTVGPNGFCFREVSQIDVGGEW